MKIKDSLIVVLFCLPMACAPSSYPSSAAAMGTGAGLGAGLGALVGSRAGSTAGGAAVGAGTGAVIGGAVSDRSSERRLQHEANAEVMRRQQVELERQRREYDLLKRQQYYDHNLRQYAVPPGESPQGLEMGTGVRRKVFRGN
jgi:uncharacterized protein YcfJ